MKKLILILLIVVTATSCKKNNENRVTVVKEVKTTMVAPTEIDVAVSTVKWKGFEPTGEHEGTISLSKGTLELNQGKLAGGSVVIDMNTIVNTDIPADSEYNAKMVGHLKSADFFDVEKFPTATFEFTEIKEIDGKLNIGGNLTIKGITKNITIPATLDAQNGITTLKSDVFTIDRTDFNVRYGSKKFFDNLKDKFINDEFELSFEIKTVQ